MRWQGCKEELSGSIMTKAMDLLTIQIVKIFSFIILQLNKMVTKTLSEGQIVEFDLIETAKGLQAINVLTVTNVRA